jgi:tetratricopeptide (TPR) repeat protein
LASTHKNLKTRVPGKCSEMLFLCPLDKNDLIIPKQKNTFNINFKHPLIFSYEKAIEHYTEAIKLKLTDPDYYFNRAEVYYDMEKYEEALTDTQKSIELNSEDEDVKELLVKIEEKIKSQ